MGGLTGYLLGKVQLEGAIGSELLGSLVATLLQKSRVSNNSKRQSKFPEGVRYIVECSERGLKLTTPGFRSRDEGFESDSESLRSIKLNESPGKTDEDLSELMEILEICGNGESQSADGSPRLHHHHPHHHPHHHQFPSSSLNSSGISIDNSSLSSISNLHVLSSDDSNSSSGNGSDSDELLSSPNSGNPSSSPSWELLPNLSSFQSHPIEDIVFCHADSLNPSILVWIVRHSNKTIALVTAFSSRAEAEQLFQKYREIRVRIKSVKVKMSTINTSSGLKLSLPPIPNIPLPPPPPPRTCSILSSTLNENKINSEEPILNIESKPSFESKIFKSNLRCKGMGSISSISRGYNSLPFQRHSYIDMNSTSLIMTTDDIDFNGLPIVKSSNHINSDTDSHDEDEVDDLPKHRIPLRPQRKLPIGFGENNKSKNGSGKPVLLVPLKNESSSKPRSSYPKESYLYHVMSRTSSTFAPYQRSLNFMSQFSNSNNGIIKNIGSSGGIDYYNWANGSNVGRPLFVPFSSWMELADTKQNGVHSSSAGLLQLPAAKIYISNKSSSPPSSSSSSLSSSRRLPGSKTSTLSHLNGKGTAKILLRDVSGHHPPGMWANWSQRVKQNFRETLMPKLNGMWPQTIDTGTNKVKKKTTKKVTFNAWATVQMV